MLTSRPLNSFTQRALASGYYLRFDPRKISEAKLNPGYYGFLQEKVSPYYVFISRVCSEAKENGCSGPMHAFMASKIQLDTEDLDLAGELIIGGRSNIIAWAPQTGYYFEKLKLDQLTEERLEKSGLPLDCYYDVKQSWLKFAEARYFGFYFDIFGKYKVINTDQIYSLDESLVEQRNAEEQRLIDAPGLTDETRKFLIALTNARKEVEFLLENKKIEPSQKYQRAKRKIGFAHSLARCHSAPQIETNELSSFRSVNSVNAAEVSTMMSITSQSYEMSRIVSENDRDAGDYNAEFTLKSPASSTVLTPVTPSISVRSVCSVPSSPVGPVIVIKRDSNLFDVSTKSMSVTAATKPSVSFATRFGSMFYKSTKVKMSQPKPVSSDLVDTTSCLPRWW